MHSSVKNEVQTNPDHHGIMANAILGPTVQGSLEHNSRHTQVELEIRNSSDAFVHMYVCDQCNCAGPYTFESFDGYIVIIDGVHTPALSTVKLVKFFYSSSWHFMEVSQFYLKSKIELIWPRRSMLQRFLRQWHRPTR